MANIDLKTPQTIVITNVAKDEEMFDAGSLQRSDLYKVTVVTEDNGETSVTTEIKHRSEISDEDLATAKKVAFKNTDRKVQMYKTNTYVTLAKGDSVTVTASYPEEIAYFLSLASDDLTVEVQEPETTPDTDPDNP